MRWLIGLAVTLVAPPAGGGPPSDPAFDLALERQAGEEAERRGDFAACAEHYLNAFEIDSRRAGADELLYNAGVCFEQAVEVDRALAAWRELAARFPRSRLRPRALVRAGILLARVARYREAADAFEEYATDYGGEKDAREALSEAARYRRALGQHRRAIKLTERWLRTYKLVPAERATALAFIAAVQQEMGDRRAALRSLDAAARAARGRDADLTAWIEARAAVLKSPRTPERPAPPPERFDRRGMAPDILVTAPLAR